jgi:hypothetical protein
VTSSIAGDAVVVELVSNRQIKDNLVIESALASFRGRITEAGKEHTRFLCRYFADS